MNIKLSCIGQWHHNQYEKLKVGCKMYYTYPYYVYYSNYFVLTDISIFERR